MTDIVDKKTRSRMMSGIKSKNTKPEILIRSALHRDGFRFRIHEKKIPGNPDIVLKKYNAVLFIHGCFWHVHDCKYFKWPKSRVDFWHNKLEKNVENDRKNHGILSGMNWRICIVWECAIREAKNDLSPIVNRIEEWLKGSNNFLEIRG